MRVYTDFDSTMIATNAAERLLWHYLWCTHHEMFPRRVWRIVRLAVPAWRRANFPLYYACLRAIPARDRMRVLRGIDPNPRWIAALNGLATRTHVTVVSRNCIDVIHDWVLQNRPALAAAGITVDCIIANSPLDVPWISPVRERAGVQHIDYLGIGQLQEAQKQEFLPRAAVYVGDMDDTVLRPFVRRFIRI